MSLDMKMCRACLTTKDDIITMDADFIHNFNLLTNLDIKLSDNVSQYTCSPCRDAVNFCTKFRDKCILSDLKFKELLSSNYEPEIVINEYDESPIVKNEIKLLYECLEYNLLELQDNHEPETPYGTKIKEETDLSPKKTTRTKSIERRVKEEWKKKEISIMKNQNDVLEYCGICSETFPDMDNLVKHLERHKLDKSCGLCTEFFYDLTHLLSHRIVHLPKNKKKCHLCLTPVIAAYNLEYHYIKMHNLRGDGGKLICKYCLSSYHTPLRLRKHVAAFHSDNKYTCDHCGKEFRNKNAIKNHMVIHYDCKVYKCDLCNFTCKLIGGLAAHKKRRHKGSVVNCRNCGKFFENQKLKDKHPCKYPSGMVCPLCGTQGIAYLNLRRHIKNHNPVRKHECHRCSAKFKNKYTLKVHIDKHDGNKTVQCDLCPKKFYCRSVFIKHRRTHTGERPYVCNICDKGFMANYNLKVHMKVHGLDVIAKKTLE